MRLFKIKCGFLAYNSSLTVILYCFDFIVHWKKVFLVSIITITFY